jgi:hypothetical protein
MTLTDGAIMFLGCVISFSIGYTLGAIRMGRYVNRRLEEIKNGMHQIEAQSRQIRQIYSKLEENDSSQIP